MDIHERVEARVSNATLFWKENPGKVKGCSLEQWIDLEVHDELVAVEIELMRTEDNLERAWVSIEKHEAFTNREHKAREFAAYFAGALIATVLFFWFSGEGWSALVMIPIVFFFAFAVIGMLSIAVFVPLTEWSIATSLRKRREAAQFPSPKWWQFRRRWSGFWSSTILQDADEPPEDPRTHFKKAQPRPWDDDWA